MRSPGRTLLQLWRRLCRLPGGTWLFSQVFGWRVPYSGSVRPHVRVLAPGHAEVEIPDRRANRQHLGSIHAIALLNAAEQASGLGLQAGQQVRVTAGNGAAVELPVHLDERVPVGAVMIPAGFQATASLPGSGGLRIEGMAS